VSAVVAAYVANAILVGVTEAKSPTGMEHAASRVSALRLDRLGPDSSTE